MATHANETTLPGILSSRLWGSSEHSGKLETESRDGNSGVIDLLSTSRPSYVIELNHLKTNARDAAVQKALAGTEEQGDRYAQGEIVKGMANLKRLAVVCKGPSLARLNVF